MFDFLKGKNGKYSLTKMGAAIIALAGTVVSLPALGVAGIPVAVVGAAKLVVAIGVAMGLTGAKNAIDKVNK